MFQLLTVFLSDQQKALFAFSVAEMQTVEAKRI